MAVNSSDSKLSSTAADDIIKFLVTCSDDDVITTTSSAAFTCSCCQKFSVAHHIGDSLKVLTCFHVVCSACLEDLCRRSRQSTPGSSLIAFSCSVCQTEIAMQRSGTEAACSDAFYDVKELRRFISGIMSSVGSKKLTLLSNNNYDVKTPLVANGEIDPLNCPLHASQPILVMCLRCRSLNCLFCWFSGHYFHDVRPFNSHEVQHLLRKAFSEALTDIKKKLLNLDSLAKNDIGNWRVGISVSVASARLEIDAEVRRMKLRVKHEAEKLHDELTSVENEVTSYGDQMKEAVELQRRRFKDCEEKLKLAMTGEVTEAGRLFMELDQTLDELTGVAISCQYPVKSVSYDPSAFGDETTAKLLGKVKLDDRVVNEISELELQERSNKSLGSKVSDVELCDEMSKIHGCYCGGCCRQHSNHHDFYEKMQVSKDKLKTSTEWKKTAEMDWTTTTFFRLAFVAVTTAWLVTLFFARGYERDMKRFNEGVSFQVENNNTQARLLHRHLAVGDRIRGIAVLDGLLYVIRLQDSVTWTEDDHLDEMVDDESEENLEMASNPEKTPTNSFNGDDKLVGQIDVYDVTTRALQRVIEVPGLWEPVDMVASAECGCLFISDWRREVIHRIQTGSSVSVTRWPVGDKPHGLSLTLDENNVLVTCPVAQIVKEFTPTGKLVRQLRLPTSIVCPWHAIEYRSSPLTSFPVKMRSDAIVAGSAFLIAHGSVGGSTNSVCLIGLMGNVYWCADELFDTILHPIRLQQVGSFVAVADVQNGRILMFSSSADAVTAIWTLLTFDHVTQDIRFSADNGDSRLYVADSKRDNLGNFIGKVQSYYIF